MKNIILITVDALRYDHSKIVKNKMDEILGQGIDFENAYSTGPSTSMSYIGLLCSKFPTFPDEINSIAKLGVNRKRTLLYEILKNSGFNTYVISNCLFNRFYGCSSRQLGESIVSGFRAFQRIKTIEVTRISKFNTNVVISL